MNDLEKLLNNPDAPKLEETDMPKKIEKPTPAANRAVGLAAQESILAAASAGGSIFRSAATYLADHPVIKGYQKESDA